MDLYRVAPEAYALDLTGEGAKKAGGRWNPSGTPVIYTAEHATLAMLEVMAHLDRSCAPKDLQLATITVPDNMQIFMPSKEEIPADWDARPGKTSTVLFGRNWLDEASFPILKVPSIMTPYGVGWNYLLNPLHPKLAGKMTVIGIDWPIDPRLFP
jgi:RES domain-containing protein